MDNEIIHFYSAIRQIFGVCNKCGEIFRLSDSKLYQRSQFELDWKESLDKEINHLNKLEQQLLKTIEQSKMTAREIGRKNADEQIKIIDKIFNPNELNPNDAKVIFHPIDFLVFNGMNDNNEPTIKNLVFLDKDNKIGNNKIIQNSIQETIESENYEWLTLRVEENGKIVVE